MHITKQAAVILGATVAVLAIGGGIAYATIPDGGGTIHACYKPTSDGHKAALSVIDTGLSGGHCPADNTELTWSQGGGGGSDTVSVSGTFTIPGGNPGPPPVVGPDCPADHSHATGGGWNRGAETGAAFNTVLGQFPDSATPSGWRVRVQNGDTDDHTIVVYAVCAA